jgi:hypothetical protein
LLQGVFIGQNLDKVWVQEQLQCCQPQHALSQQSGGKGINR